MSRPLEPYIQEINQDGHYLAQSTLPKSPRLRPDRVNRILFYPGCFNPPHIGHASLLHHVFSNAGEDLNVIAAIVVPRDKDKIERKLKRKGGDNQLKLTKSERVMLWNGHEPSDYFWVFAAPEYYWDDFWDQLIDNIQRDGFEVKLCALWGPEYVEDLEDKTIFDYGWGCVEVFTSDISRDSTIMPPGQTVPRQLQRHITWARRVIPADEAASTAARAKVWTFYPWRCLPFYTIRFITKPKNHRVPRTSSTKIRESLQYARKLRSGGLTGYVRNVVLRPDLLAGIIFGSSP